MFRWQAMSFYLARVVTRARLAASLVALISTAFTAARTPHLRTNSSCRIPRTAILANTIKYIHISFLFLCIQALIYIFCRPTGNVVIYLRFLANVNSSSRSLFVIGRPSVCRLSVTLVHPTQAIEIFGNISTPCGTLAIHDLCMKILRRSSEGNPSVGGVKHKRGSRIQRFWTYSTLYLGNGARQELSYY